MTNHSQQSDHKNTAPTAAFDSRSNSFDRGPVETPPASEAKLTKESAPPELDVKYVAELAEILGNEQDRLDRERAEADRLNKTRRGNRVAFDLD